MSRSLLLLDGAMGTMIRRCGLAEADFRGARFASHPCDLAGCNDVLVLTRPDVVAGIHSEYLAAGADIISTDSFNANALSLADYGLAEHAREIARAAAAVARTEADRFTALDPRKPRFVAGSVGPTNRTSSIVCDIEHPEVRDISFGRLAEVYTEQIEALVEGGVDLILFETVFDTLNAKAAIYALKGVEQRLGRKIPSIISGTVADSSGRMLSGQTVEAFYTSVAHLEPLCAGFNCAFGAEKMLPYLERLAEISEFPVSAHPNAGLPNIDGGYDETPEMFAAAVSEFLRRGLVNIVGGCCGTTPEHIAALAAILPDYKPRPLPVRRHITRLSGLEELKITPEINFVNIGERSNVAGSAKFARLIRAGEWDGAVAVARAQVEAGAQIIDVCMDDGMIDGAAAMSRFLTILGAEPEIARVPVMVDSSSWETIEAGLRAVQGKCIVNSLSLKEGEQSFLEHARLARRYGAAAVVMLFDEQGQADTFERKIEVARRAYDLLTGDGFPPEDIVFDPNVLTVATGIPEHNKYGKAFIDATRWIKKNLPGAKVSGGVSNLSFAFRGNNPVREAMHAVFLHHAAAAGMDMGIVNPQMSATYETLDAELRERAEDLVLDRRADAAELMTDYAQRHTPEAAAQNGPATGLWRCGTVAERISYALQRGISDFIEADTLEAAAAAERPAEVIDRLLMPAMEHIGELFGEGKMFLPQVIKSAAVMKRAIAALAPLMAEEGREAQAGCIVIATVKGDVHDIGKNIVSLITSCNGYRVVDLGVSVEAGRIVDEAERCGADAICLSGLITPSLEEMRRVCAEAERRGLKIPVIVGGAAVSELHTAVRIAPSYSGVVINARNASDNGRLLARLTGRDREAAEREIAERQRTLREEFGHGGRGLRPLAECRRERRTKSPDEVAVPQHTGVLIFPDIEMKAVEKYFDWNFFFSSWEVKGRWPEILDDPEKGVEARRLYEDAQALLERIRTERLLTLQGAVGVFPAVSCGDDIVVTDKRGRKHRLPMLRSQSRGEEPLSLADFIVPEGAGKSDYIGCFALTAGVGLAELCATLRDEGGEYEAVMAKLLADRLTEALAETLHTFVRRQMWGYETSAPQSPASIVRGEYRGRRMAFGYPASPDHSLKREVFDLLGVEKTTAMTLTDNCMIVPGEALCGLFFADAEYFAVGKIDEEQAADYARRRGITLQRVRELLPHNTEK